MPRASISTAVISVQPSKRDLVIRGLVERSADADLAATRLLFDLLRKADPHAIANPDETRPLGVDAVALLKERLARLARAQTAPLRLTAEPASAAEPSDPDQPPIADLPTADPPPGK